MTDRKLHEGAPSEVPPRISTKEKGNEAEDRACDYMRARGYTIVARNWKAGNYEIDIICRKDQRVVFVEVKKRESLGFDPAAAVNRAKRSRLIRAADCYLKMCNLPLDYQFDIIAISGKGQHANIEHIEDAFFPSVR